MYEAIVSLLRIQEMVSNVQESERLHGGLNHTQSRAENLQ